MRVQLAAFFGLLAAAALLSSTSALTPNDTDYSQQWNMPITRTDEAWDYLTGSDTVRIAIVSGGVNVSSELSGLVTTGWNTVTNSTDTTDDAGSYGSGTMQASIVAANTNNADGIAGMNWDIEILPVDVCHWVNNMFLGCDAAELAEGIDWARTHGAEIILTHPQIFVTSTALNNAIAASIAAGIPVISGVGAAFPASKYPADIPGVIGVGSTDSTDDHSSFSAIASYVDFAAPGEGVYVLVNGGCCLARAGTQLAAAHVAGAVALLAGIGITPQRAAEDLVGEDLGTAGYDTTYGNGRLDVMCTIVHSSDVTDDGTVDTSDALEILADPWYGSADYEHDVNGGGDVDLADALIALDFFGATC